MPLQGTALRLTFAAAVVAAVGFDLPYVVAGTSESAANLAAADNLPLRDSWARSDTRFLRNWFVLGPQPGTLEGDELAAQGGQASVHPASGTAAPTKEWRNLVQGWDVVDMAGWLSSPPYRGSEAAPEVGYAFNVISRDREGDALLSLGRDTGVRIWVNGVPTYSAPTSSGFSLDHDRIPVHFRLGENRLLLKFEHRSGPWHFALRVLEPGTILPNRDEVIPQVSATKAGILRVRAVSAHTPRGSPVQILVTAAGGVTVARSVSARDETVEFHTAAWPDGAYEVHLATKTPWDRVWTAHASWYKGDALVAARRLLADAPAVPIGARASTVRLLADFVRDRLGDHFPDDGWPLIHSPLMEYEELQQEARHRPGPVHPWGFVRLAYIDDTDASPQFCSAYLPAHYDAARRWPLVMYLHGSIPGNPPYVDVQEWNLDARHNESADRHDVIFLQPYGRGNAQYVGIGEQDVLRCLEAAKRRFSVDDDRIYLTGESMGGTGTWLIASRHPELFAAVAPVYGGGDGRISHDPALDNPHATSLPERFSREVQSSFTGAEALLNLPLLVHHGDEDRNVSVENSRYAVRMLQRWGYDVRYREYPGRGHESLDDQEEIVAWLLTHRRVAAPRTVRIRATDLGGAAAYWVRVTAWEMPLTAMQVDAEVIEPGVIRLDTQNVASLQLSPPSRLRNGVHPVHVVWNGIEHVLPSSADGTMTLSIDGARETSLSKRAGLDGALSNFITTPFAVVVGTASADPVMNRLCREKAQVFQALWKIWQHQEPRVLTDDQVTPQDEQRYSLLLIGGADANLVTRRIASRLPLRVEADGVTIDGRKFPASDAVVQMLYPNPAQPARYVLVVASTSAAGMYFWEPYLWSGGGMPLGALDWSIRDGRQVVLERGLGTERAWVASGVFDMHWRRDDRWVFPGDADLRAASPLRRMPAMDIRVAAETLDSYVGRYELTPGYVISIERTERGLSARFPGGIIPLSPESGSDFGLATAALISFRRDANGVVTGFTLGQESREMFAKKIVQGTP